jgi:ribosome-associated protein
VLSSKETAILAANAMADKKAIDVVAIEVAELLVVTDFFVIATGNTAIQVRAIADEVEDQLREKAGTKPIGREGADGATWILLDYADVVVHVFQPDEREFYRLEKLWSDAPRLALPETGTDAS